MEALLVQPVHAHQEYQHATWKEYLINLSMNLIKTLQKQHTTTYGKISINF